MIQAYDGVRQQLQRSAGYNKRYYDIGVRPSRFEAGQWVWYFNPRKLQGKQMKWTQQYEGPYLILQMHTTVVAEIQQSSRTKQKSVHIDKLKKFEGEEPKVWPAAAARISTARQGNHDDAVRVDASSLWENERSHRETEEAVRTTGEVHFGSAESADGPTNPFPVLGVKAESADGPTNPSPTIQLERYRSDLAPDRTDDEGNPTSVGSMETAELKEFDPLADCQLDTAEDYLHPAIGNTSQDAGSSDISENLPDQYTGSLDTQESGSPERQTADELDTAIVASLTARAPVHAEIYPNFGSISPIIIIENKRRESLPMMNLDATEGSDRLERGDQETTVTTHVAGTEPTTRTGHQYSQIPETHAETDVKRLEETSREYRSVGQPVIENVTAEPEKDQLRTDLCESRARDDVTPRKREVRERRKSFVQDDAPDQPPSAEQANTRATSTPADTNDDNEPTTLEKVKVQTSPGTEELDDSDEENMPTLQSATIDCGPESNIRDQPSPQHQRPLRHANRPTRFRDTAFDTHFEPKLRRKKCQKIRQLQDTKKYIINQEGYFRQGRGAYQHLSQKNGKATFTEKATPVDLQTRHSPTTSAKTSTNLLKCLTTDTLQLSPTAAENAAINKSITAARPLKAARPTSAAAVAADRGTATRVISKVKPTAKFPVAIISASAAGKIQIASADRSIESTHPDTNKIHCQQLDRPVQIITVPASTNSVESAVQSNLTITTT